MRALVTGGAGFLGSHLCDYLLAHDWDVVCIDNEVTGTESNLCHLLGNTRFEYVRADVSRDLTYAGSLDYVLHFASPVQWRPIGSASKRSVDD